MSKECECPPEHTVAKLGHCRSCPYYATWPKLKSPEQAERDVSTAYACGTDKCPATGREHNFDWATYADDTMSYGVCQCGYDAMTHDLFTGP